MGCTAWQRSSCGSVGLLSRLAHAVCLVWGTAGAHAAAVAAVRCVARVKHCIIVGCCLTTMSCPVVPSPQISCMQVKSGQTRLLQPGGALMLGNEQDCW